MKERGKRAVSSIQLVEIDVIENLHDTTLLLTPLG